MYSASLIAERIAKALPEAALAQFIFSMNKSKMAPVSSLTAAVVINVLLIATSTFHLIHHGGGKVHRLLNSIFATLCSIFLVASTKDNQILWEKLSNGTLAPLWTIKFLSLQIFSIMIEAKRCRTSGFSNPVVMLVLQNRCSIKSECECTW
ncbi:LOW QUALITY PROTEIN: hypothetical protein PanWU01x14_124500 [Parasponia andersonii]|uniref:Uncharacterized protein n=1 Tax=Parasponia andersonii TaxID=3476 RepID=A0A2P5CTN0_PARAD|nr:LOW QUALITY PROTEIN: hypothetical protein PanWU01x14_124500 [Parasponia andersonii]